MTTKHAAVIRKTYKGTETTVARTVAPSPQADLAERLMHTIAIAACKTDGENSDGSQKIITLTPEEVVQRACAIADLSYLEFDAKAA